MNTHLLLAKLDAIWVCLAASPLLGPTVTLLAYLIALSSYARAKYNRLTDPVPIVVAR